MSEETAKVVESKIVNPQSPSMEQVLPPQHVEQVKQDGGALNLAAEEARDRAAALASHAENEVIRGRRQYAYGGPPEVFAATEAVPGQDRSR